MKEGRFTYAFFLDVKKAYDTVWRDGLWYKMWEMGVKGKMWRVVRFLYVHNRSCVFLRVSLLNFFQLIGGLLRVLLCCLPCF